VNKTIMAEPAKTTLRPAAPWGVLPVAVPPKYQLPMSVKSPFSVNIAAFGPTLETLLRNDPKYE
ncbi:hypothetical protein Q9189_007905, partial [Teloschistes chrysophthalmus]